MRARLFWIMLALLVGACRKQPKPPDRTAPWLASAAPSASARPALRRLTYVLGPSRVEFELPARRANPKGRFSHATGELDVDLDDLSHTTGGVRLDLTTIELTSNDGLVDAPNTAHALDWLELGAGIPGERRDTLRQVGFTVSSLDAGHLVAAPSDERPTRRRDS